MADTLTIRLRAEDRRVLEEAARDAGKGLSALVRELAEAEAGRLRRERTRAEGERVMAAVRADERLRKELELLGTPLHDLP